MPKQREKRGAAHKDTGSTINAEFRANGASRGVRERISRDKRLVLVVIVVVVVALNSPLLGMRLYSRSNDSRFPFFPAMNF